VGQARVGDSSTPIQTVPLIWRGLFRTFSVLPLPAECDKGSGRSGAALDINDQGVIVGTCASRAIIWRTPSSTAELLPSPARLPNDTDLQVYAEALNDHGAIVGRAVHIQGDVRIHQELGWTADGRIVELGDVLPTAINDSGETVGSRGDRAVRVRW
jgi:hypothetical protein